MKTMIILKSDPINMIVFPGCRPVVYKDGTVHVRDQVDADVQVFPARRISRMMFEPEVQE